MGEDAAAQGLAKIADFGTAAFCDIFGRWFGDDLGTTTWFHGTAIRSEPPAWRAESELAKLRRHAEQLDADTNL